jgi:rfaE bifunctional protein nucleotidyltransferase chain/domain
VAGCDNKIIDLEALATRLEAERAAGRRVVHCHGVFDLLHLGHIRYLQRARELGEVLVVTVTPDRWVNKGPHRPAFTETLRAEAIASLACVDFVALNAWPTAAETIALLRPAVYAKGAEFRSHRTPEIVREEAAAAAAGTAIAFIEDLTSSSSELLNRYFSPFGEEVDHYLEELRAAWPAPAILDRIAAAKELKPLVVGEMIIDEYVYCNTLGQSAKAPIVAMQYASQERFAGGAAAVANHLAGFCTQVDLVCQIGGVNTEEDWIRGHLRPNVRPIFVERPGAPTIVKRRYRESYYSQPVFEVYQMDDSPPDAAQEQRLAAALVAAIGGHDLVLAVDHGHAMLTAPAVDLLAAESRFLAVSTQTNAANVGYHTVAKYPRADFVCLAEQDVRLQCRSRTGPLEPLVAEVAERLGASVMAATCGSRGCVCRGPEGQTVSAPALATKVVDRVGAGDAFLALAALMAAMGAPLELLAFLGNVAGAEAAATIGNAESLDALRLGRHVQSLLK